MSNELTSYEYLWTTNDWCLVRSDERIDEFIIFDCAKSTVLSLTDECLHDRLVRKMIEEGVKVLQDLPSREISLDDFTIEG